MIICLHVFDEYMSWLEARKSYKETDADESIPSDHIFDVKNVYTIILISLRSSYGQLAYFCFECEAKDL